MALASAMGRQVTFAFGPFDMPVNLYVLLLAPSSIFRKTTALTLSRRIATQAGAYELAGDGSPEGFLEDLEEHPQGTLYYSEFSLLLAQFDRTYAASLRPLLTDLYDCPRSYRRKLRGTEINIADPCVSIFGASVLDWVLDRVKQSDFGGGFLTRFVLVSATVKEKRMPIPPPADIQAENALVAGLLEIMNLVEGQVNLDSIRSDYEKWAIGFEARARSPLLAAFISRLQVACLKLTVLEQLSETASTALTPGALARAAANIEEVADTIAELEDTELGYGNDRESQEQRRVARIVRTAGEISWTQLLRRSHMLTRRLRTVTQTLADGGSIEITTHPKPGKGGRPLQVVKWMDRSRYGA